jgi:hypothetical protein
MQRIVRSITTLGVMCALAGAASATGILEERVTGGVLDLTWTPGFGVPNNLEAVTLGMGDAGYANPSGDHTAGRLTNSDMMTGGIALAAIDPNGAADYTWEARIFTGNGDTRRGLVVRADPGNGFASCYQFVIQQGLLQLNFRKLVNGMPATLGGWLTTSTPGGLPSPNTWHTMKIVAQGNEFRCFWDDFELTTTPITDTDLATGWAGVYNFRFDIGGIPFLVDDLKLTPLDKTVAVEQTTWAEVKHLFAR